jgi:hypothetical protein
MSRRWDHARSARSRLGCCLFRSELPLVWRAPRQWSVRVGPMRSVRRTPGTLSAASKDCTGSLEGVVLTIRGSLPERLPQAADSISFRQ